MYATNTLVHALQISAPILTSPARKQKKIFASVCVIHASTVLHVVNFIYDGDIDNNSELLATAHETRDSISLK